MRCWQSRRERLQRRIEQDGAIPMVTVGDGFPLGRGRLEVSAGQIMPGHGVGVPRRDRGQARHLPPKVSDFGLAPKLGHALGQHPKGAV